MATNLAFDSQLLQEAVVIGGFKSKKDAINQALREFIQRHKQREIVDLFGKFPADTDYDYKKVRPGWDRGQAGTQQLDPHYP